MDILTEIKEQAEELINFGDSKEKARGYGMLEVLNRIGKYVRGYNVLDEYFDSIAEEEQSNVHKILTELGMYEKD
jgi:hypothetical protein